MPSLFDPLFRLYFLGANARLEIFSNGTRHVTLTFSRTSTLKGQRQAQAIAARLERLLLMQPAVPPGCQPLIVQQLVAAGKILVVNGRYKEKPG